MRARNRLVSRTGWPALRLAVCLSLVMLGGAGCSGATAAVSPSSETPAADTAVAQRDPDVPDLPFADNPDPSQCGIPTAWGGYRGWVTGLYMGDLIQPSVLLYDSHRRAHVTGALPSGSEVQIQLYQANPVLDFYFVQAETPSGTQQGWVPGPFLRLSPPPS